MSDGSASRLIADALDLRHRLRSIWTAARAGKVPAHQARHIATATRIGNLRPYARRHHNYKTHCGWQVRQPEPGT
jgi:hypothetical protein